MRSKTFTSRNKTVVLYEDGTVKRQGVKQTLNVDKNGYVRLTIFGVRKRLHQWMAQSFLPNPENKPCVNHIDGNKSNNHISNLEWATYKENNDHAAVTGLMGRHCETHTQASLTNEQVLEIVAKWNSGKYDFRYDIAHEYGVSQGTIEKILRGERWAKITGIKKNADGRGHADRIVMEAERFYRHTDMTMADIARRLNVSASVIGRWKKLHQWTKA